jgi:hypothetical protein
MPSITCGSCHSTHSSIQAVRDCYNFKEPEPAPYLDYEHKPSGEKYGDETPDHLKEADELAKLYPRKTVDPSERVYLSVPYEDKDKAKPLGARWDKGAKLWWVSQEDWDKHADDLRQWKPEPIAVRKVGEPKRPAAEVKALSFTPEQLPGGYYALLNEENAWKFYRVSWGKEGGRWEGRAFLEVQASDDLHKISNPHTRNAIFARIAEDPREAALQYGHQVGQCSRCNRTLTDEQSIADGIGPVCKEKAGW